MVAWGSEVVIFEPSPLEISGSDGKGQSSGSREEVRCVGVYHVTKGGRGSPVALGPREEVRFVGVYHMTVVK